MSKIHDFTSQSSINVSALIYPFKWAPMKYWIFPANDKHLNYETPKLRDHELTPLKSLFEVELGSRSENYKSLIWNFHCQCLSCWKIIKRSQIFWRSLTIQPCCALTLALIILSLSPGPLEVSLISWVSKAYSNFKALHFLLPLPWWPVPWIFMRLHILASLNQFKSLTLREIRPILCGHVRKTLVSC